VPQPHFNVSTGRWELPGDLQHHHPQGWAPRPMAPPHLPPRPSLVNTSTRPATPPAGQGRAAHPGPAGPVPPVPRPVPLTSGAGAGRAPRQAARRWPWVVAIVAAFLVGLAIPTGGGSGPVTEVAAGALDVPAAPAGPITYAFEVTTEGVDSVGNLMWNNGEGGMETRDDRAAPFRETVTVPSDRPWTMLQVTAQLPIGADAGASITCVIRDSAGRTLDTQTSRGLYAVATCNSAGL
jgi:hypothetical protein